MAAKKPTVEIDERIIKVLKEELSDFEKYLPSPQDRKMYERKITEYLDRTRARLREETQNDGRGIDDLPVGAN